MLKLEILSHLSKKKKKKITTTPQLKEQTQFVIFSPNNAASQFIWAWVCILYGKAKILETGKARNLGTCSVVFGSWTKCKICTYCKTNPNYFLLSFFGLETSILKGKVTGSNISCLYCQVVNLIYIWSPVFVRKW